MTGGFENTNYKLKRWYDAKPFTQEVLEVLSTLSVRSHYDIAREVIKVVEVIKTSNREREEIPLSLGIERVIGLYQQQHSRRWYDKSLPISRVFKTASCLPDEDFHNIMQGISLSLGVTNEQ